MIAEVREKMAQLKEESIVFQLAQGTAMPPCFLFVLIDTFF
jgi:hypothetical protein